MQRITIEEFNIKLKELLARLEDVSKLETAALKLADDTKLLFGAKYLALIEKGIADKSYNPWKRELSPELETELNESQEQKNYEDACIEFDRVSSLRQQITNSIADLCRAINMPSFYDDNDNASKHRRYAYDAHRREEAANLRAIHLARKDKACGIQPAGFTGSYFGNSGDTY